MSKLPSDPPSLSPSSETRKKTARQNLVSRDPGGKKHAKNGFAVDSECVLSITTGYFLNSEFNKSIITTGHPSSPYLSQPLPQVGHSFQVELPLSHWNWLSVHQCLSLLTQTCSHPPPCWTPLGLANLYPKKQTE